MQQNVFANRIKLIEETKAKHIANKPVKLGHVVSKVIEKRVQAEAVEEDHVEKAEQEIMRKLKINHRFSDSEVLLALNNQGSLRDVMSHVHVPASYFRMS